MSLKRKRSALQRFKEEVLEDGIASRPLSAFAAARAQQQIVSVATEDASDDEPLNIDGPSVSNIEVESSDGENEAPLLETTSTPLDPRWKQFSTWSASKVSIRHEDATSLTTRLLPDESIIAFGSYQLKVLAGKVSVLGAELTARSGTQDIHATALAALPRITCISNGSVDIRLSNLENPLDVLRDLSPHFIGISRTPHDAEDHRTFHIIPLPGDEYTTKNHLFPLHEPEQWRTSRPLTPTDPPPIILITGPRTSGKSTFAQIIANAYLTHTKPAAHPSTTNSTRQKPSSSPEKAIYILDLAASNPTYTTRGQISLLRITAPILSTSPCLFSSSISSSVEVIRAHPIPPNGHIDHPNYFLACIGDLTSTYRALESSSPLIVDTPWYSTPSTLSTLQDIVEVVKPREVFDLSMPSAGNGPVYSAVDVLGKGGVMGIMVRVIAQPNSASIRTEAQRGEMALMAYFHRSSRPQHQPTEYSGTPLLQREQVEISYHSDNPGILGILPLSPLPPSHLPSLLSHSLVALVHSSLPTVLESHKSRANDVGLPILASDRMLLDPVHSELVGMAYLESVNTVRRTLSLHHPAQAMAEIEARSLNPESLVLIHGHLPTSFADWISKEAPFREYAEGLRRVRESGLFDVPEDGRRAVEALNGVWRGEMRQVEGVEEREGYVSLWWGGIKLGRDGGETTVQNDDGEAILA